MLEDDAIAWSGQVERGGALAERRLGQ